MVEPAVLRDFMQRMLRAGGCPPASAAAAADVFLEADLRGIGLQGLDHIPSMIRQLRVGQIDPLAIPDILKRGPGFVHVDGRRGPGQIAAIFAADIAIEQAKGAICCAGVVNSSDAFMLGYYVERIARAGLVGMMFSDAPPLVHPHGGTDRMLGTNPIALAFPIVGEHPLVIDMATSAMSASRIRQASYFEESVSEGIGIDAAGKPTRDAAQIRSGAIAPLAGHKGFALALAVALLSGPLVGAQTGPALDGWFSTERTIAGAKGHLIIAIDPACYGDPRAYRAATSAYLQQVKMSAKADGVSHIRLPGERTFSTRERSLREGVRIYEIVWNNAARLAAELGIDVPSPSFS